MPSVSNLLAIVASFVIIFFGNYLFYGVLAAGFFESHMGSATGVQKEEVSMAFIALGCLIQAYALATLYSKWANGSYTPTNGFQFGAIAGLLTGFGLGFVMFGTTHLMDLTGHLVDGLWYVVLYGLAGMAMAAIMNKTQADATGE